MAIYSDCNLKWLNFCRTNKTNFLPIIVKKGFTPNESSMNKYNYLLKYLLVFDILLIWLKWEREREREISSQPPNKSYKTIKHQWKRQTMNNNRKQKNWQRNLHICHGIFCSNDYCTSNCCVGYYCELLSQLVNMWEIYSAQKLKNLFLRF